jgi:hypothetical protein
MSREPYAIVALIQQQVGKRLEEFVAVQAKNVGRFTGDADKNLLQQLAGNDVVPKGIDLGFMQDVGAFVLPQLLQNRDPLDIVRGLFAEQRDAIEKLLDAGTPQEALAAGREFLEKPLGDVWKTVGPFLAGQFSILVSFATTALTLPKTAGPAIEDALLRYFFTPGGYETVDGTQIVAPIHLADIDLGKVGQLKAVFSERTAERYVRDLVRLTVEAADDARYYDLKRRYAATLELLADDDQRTKCVSWFKGFSSMAEAAVTASVEEACLGVASFQSNALIAASAGTFAGTAARKATQHVFLSELEHLRQVAKQA